MWGGGCKYSLQNCMLGKNRQGYKTVCGVQNRLRATEQTDSYRGQQNQLMTTKQYEYQGQNSMFSCFVNTCTSIRKLCFWYLLSDQVLHLHYQNQELSLSSSFPLLTIPFFLRNSSFYFFLVQPLLK